MLIAFDSRAFLSSPIFDNEDATNEHSYTRTKPLSPNRSKDGFSPKGNVQRLGRCLIVSFLDLFLFRYSFRLFPARWVRSIFVHVALLPFWVLRFRFPFRVALTLGLGLVGSSGSSKASSPRGNSPRFLKFVPLYLYYWYLAIPR